MEKECDPVMEHIESDCDFDGSMSVEINSSLAEGDTQTSNSSTSTSCSGMCCNSLMIHV